MNRCSIYEEYRLIELRESQIHGAWKGGHLLLFFMAFVFGSFCTFCFHMLTYIFDDKCVLFPKLVHVTNVQQQHVSEIFPIENAPDNAHPVDFVSTVWVDQKICYLPMYVPLVSGLFGLVWTTMFLMCTSGRGTLAGLQQPWRVLPLVFVFSLAMGAVCIYAAYVTHTGLNELCNKLAEATGADSCSYTINVATLIYERRIHGIYQASKLTILLAWLHTSCWLASALLAAVRMLVAADFQLVRIDVEVVGDIERMLEQHEEHLHTVFPDPQTENILSQTNSKLSTEVLFSQTSSIEVTQIYVNKQTIASPSNISLVPDEKMKLKKRGSFKDIGSKKTFIAKLLNNLVDSAIWSVESREQDIYSGSSRMLFREIGRERLHELSNVSAKVSTTKHVKISPKESKSTDAKDVTQPQSGEKVVKNIEPIASTSKSPKKQNVKHVTIQTDSNDKAVNSQTSVKAKYKPLQLVIDENSESSHESNDRDKATQTQKKKKKKEKED